MKTWTSWIHNCRGAAAVECAMGTAAMVAVSALALDVYRLADAQATMAHTAVTVADYVSREENPVAAHIEALAKFLHRECLAPSDAAFVVGAVQRKPGDQNPTLLWTRQVLVGPDATTDPELAACSQVGAAGATANLPAGFTMRSNEAVIVAEVCVKHAGELVYRHHILPIRADEAPPAPV